MANYTVWLETGVSVNLDDNIDPESTEGHKLLKKAALEKLKKLVEDGDIDINWEADD